MRRLLSDSIYLWACGEKADDEDDDPKLSDRLIGWLILLMQGFAYTVLIVLARATSSSEDGRSANDRDESGYILASVTGAMYLLVASTTHDLRAGFSLFVDGSCAGNRAFGIGLLVVYGIMMTAAMTVLVSTSDNSASVVLNAVTVLFIADMDEKALNFLLTVPQNWRLFWAIESIGISFALAVIAIIYIGDSSPLLEGNNGVLQTWPIWFVWMVNPAAATVVSVLVSSTLQMFCDGWSEACESVDEPTLRLTAKRVFIRIIAIVKRTHECYRGQPCYFVIQGCWLAQTVLNWVYMQGKGGWPMAFVLAPVDARGSKEHSLELTDERLVMLSLNSVLGFGLALKAWVTLMARQDRVTAILEPRRSSERIGSERRWRRCADSRVPSLLVGWGIGYWATSLLSVCVCAWRGSECGWYSAPIIVRAISYVIVPCVLIAGLLMVADPNLLGTRFGAFMKPAALILTNRGRVEYWVMASVYRDFVVLWIGYCNILRLQLEQQL